MTLSCSFILALNWLSGKRNNDSQDFEDRDSPVGDPYTHHIRKASCYHARTKLPKNASKAPKRTFADRIGIRTKKKEHDHDSQSEDFITETSDDQNTLTKDDELIFYKATKIVPRVDLKLGMARLTFLLDSCCPGSIPDPLLLAAIIDMVGEPEQQYL